MRSTFSVLRPRVAGGLVMLLGASLNSASAAFYDVPGLRVEAMASAREDFDSNIFLNSGTTGDFVSTFTGSVTLVRDVALIKSQLTVGATALGYADHGDQKSIDGFIRGNAVYSPSDKTTLSTGLSYGRNTMANEVLNTRTKSDDFNFDGSLQSLFTEKLGYRLVGNYREGKYITAGYSDVHSYSAGLNGLYIYSPKLTLVYGYTYRESWTKNRAAGAPDPSSNDSRYSLGFEGELAPKVSGSLSFGWVKRSFATNQFEASSAFFLSSGLKWVPAQKTSVSIDASQDFDTTAANQSSKTGSFSVGVTQVLTPKWSTDFSLAYTHAIYTGSVAATSRRDDNYRAKSRVSYALATNISVEASLGYGHVDSTLAVSTYDRVNGGVGATISF